MHIVGVNRANVKDHLAYCGKGMKVCWSTVRQLQPRKFCQKKKLQPRKIPNQTHIADPYYKSMLYNRLVEPSRHGTDKATSRD